MANPQQVSSAQVQPPAPAPTVDPSSAAAAMQAMNARWQPQINQASEDLQKSYASENQALAAQPKVAPPQQDFKPVMKDMDGLTGIMLVLGALGGRHTMQPMTAALNNMTGVLTGLKEGNDEQVKMQRQQFEDNYKQGMERYKAFIDERNEIHNKYMGDQAAMREHLNDLYRRMGVDEKQVQFLEGQELRKELNNENILARAQQHKDSLDAAARAHDEATNKWTYAGTDPTTGKPMMINGKGEMKVGELPMGAKPSAKGSSQTAVRQSIVKSGVTNSLARLDEIDKKFGDDTTTSSFFGTHGENPLTKSIYGAGKGMQGNKQQEADSDWGSFIDEAIPVFTGGLRGSDSFRQFLMQQAPQPGDKPETVKEKKRLFRENINGTSKAFFSKFASDPQMQAPGTKPEDIQSPESGGGEWKVEKVQ